MCNQGRVKNETLYTSHEIHFLHDIKSENDSNIMNQFGKLLSSQVFAKLKMKHLWG